MATEENKYLPPNNTSLAVPIHPVEKTKTKQFINDVVNGISTGIGMIHAVPSLPEKEPIMPYSKKVYNTAKFTTVALEAWGYYYLTTHVYRYSLLICYGFNFFSCISSKEV